MILALLFATPCCWISAECLFFVVLHVICFLLDVFFQCVCLFVWEFMWVCCFEKGRKSCFFVTITICIPLLSVFWVMCVLSECFCLRSSFWIAVNYLILFQMFRFSCLFSLFKIDWLLLTCLLDLILLVSMLMCVCFVLFFVLILIFLFLKFNQYFPWNLITIRGVKKKHWNIKCLNLFLVSFLCLNFIYVCVSGCECVWYLLFLSFLFSNINSNR